MAKTSLPCSFASRAVMREPLFTAASTTKAPKLNPAIMRLRRGKFCALGSVPTGNSEIMAPCSTI